MKPSIPLVNLGAGAYEQALLPGIYKQQMFGF
jgi:hypothetical protein